MVNNIKYSQVLPPCRTQQQKHEHIVPGSWPAITRPLQFRSAFLWMQRKNGVLSSTITAGITRIVFCETQPLPGLMETPLESLRSSFRALQGLDINSPSPWQYHLVMSTPPRPLPPPPPLELCYCFMGHRGRSTANELLIVGVIVSIPPPPPPPPRYPPYPPSS